MAGSLCVSLAFGEIPWPKASSTVQPERPLGSMHDKIMPQGVWQQPEYAYQDEALLHMLLAKQNLSIEAYQCLPRVLAARGVVYATRDESIHLHFDAMVALRQAVRAECAFHGRRFRWTESDEEDWKQMALIHSRLPDHSAACECLKPHDPALIDEPLRLQSLNPRVAPDLYGSHTTLEYRQRNHTPLRPGYTPA
jgi:hypothetical protein